MRHVLLRKTRRRTGVVAVALVGPLLAGTGVTAAAASAAASAAANVTAPRPADPAPAPRVAGGAMAFTAAMQPGWGLGTPRSTRRCGRTLTRPSA